MKSAILAALLCTLATLTACGGPDESTSAGFASNVATHDDTVFLRNDASAFTDRTCQCQLQGAQAEPLPRGCDLPVKPDGSVAPLRACHFAYAPGTPNYVPAQVY